MISVVIHNQSPSDLLIKTLISLESQSYKDFEVIIIDSCESDFAWNLLDQYQRLTPPFPIWKSRQDTLTAFGDIKKLSKSLVHGDKVLFFTAGKILDNNFLNRYDKTARFEAVLSKEVFFPKLKINVLNDHASQVGGGTIHSFRFLEYLKPYYDIDVYVPDQPKSEACLKRFFNISTKGLKLYEYTDGVFGGSDVFLNISHWRIAKSLAKKKWALIFFPRKGIKAPKDFKFLANSQYTKKNIQKRWNVGTERIEVIYPPIILSNFKPLKKTNTILHVSRISAPIHDADKGHKQMIEAFKDMVDSGLRGWTFHVVGEVQSPPYYTKLLEISQTYPILFHRAIPLAKLRKLYGQAKIYWHMTGISMPKIPSAQEHFGMTTVEAMASGAVPISLNRGGPLEVIKQGKNGFLVNGIKGLKNTTLSLIENPRRLNRISKSAIKRSKDFDEKFSKAKLYSVITKTDKVSVIILCHNNLEFTKKCIKSLYDVTPSGFELILVDNASSDTTKKYLKKVQRKYDNVKCIFNRKNMGFAKANNKALQRATREYICYLNNDTELQWGWLERLVDVLEDKPKVAIVGARMYFPNENPNGSVWVIQHAGIKYDDKCNSSHIGRFKPNNEIPGFGAAEVESVTAACMLVRRPLAKFPEMYERGYYEDNDLCLGLREKGWKIYLNHDARLIHYEGQTQNLFKTKNQKKFDEVNEKNRLLFLKRWKDKIKSLPKIK